MSTLVSPINISKWVEENRQYLKPPVGNKCIYNGEYIVMIIGGPNARKDFHYNETPEFYYQIEGDIVLKVMDDGEARDIPIKEGEIFLLPAKVPHSPQRPAGTIGLVIESKRPEGMEDALVWFCENCGNKLYKENFALENIVTDLPIIFDKYYSDQESCTCDNCGETMTRPSLPE